MSAVPVAPRAAELTPTPYRVRARREECAGCVTIVLAPHDEALPRGQAGQFHMLWAFGVGEVPISIAAFGPGHHVEHLVRDVGPTTHALCRLKVGDTVGVRGPYGRGFDASAARDGHLLIVAGGIGLAPVRPVIFEAIARRSEYRRVTVVSGARTPDTSLYLDEAHHWREGGLDVHLTVDTAAPGWTGSTGFVTAALAEAVPAVDAGAPFAAIVCGPEPMMAAVASQLCRAGARPEQLQLSLERNMHCAIRECGRCQLGPHFICHDGPVLDWATIRAELAVHER